MKSCSFFGYSRMYINQKLVQRLKNCISSLIKDGCDTFYFSGQGMFDELCFKIVTELKYKYKHISRIYCLENDVCFKDLPYHLTNKSYDDYRYFRSKSDSWYTRLYNRNLEIINNSDICIFYAQEVEYSRAYDALKYAAKSHKKIINFANLF